MALNHRFTQAAWGWMAMGVFAAACTQAVASPSASAYSYSPTTQPAGSGFTLKLTPLAAECGTVYQHPSVTIHGDTDLYFHFVAAPGPENIVCIEPVTPVSISFQVAALKAGTYSLYAVKMPPCAYASDPAQPVCDIALIPEKFGTLTVTPTRPSTDIHWHLNPVVVAAGKPFHLAVVHAQYGSCQTEFTHAIVNVDSINRKISTRFGVIQHPDRVCIQDVSPHGPSFSMPALPAGQYAVDVSVLPACAIPATPTSPICLIEPVPVQTAELLSVMDTTLTYGKEWSLESTSAPANVDFTLKLRSSKYPTCKFTFPHGAYQLDGNRISLRFGIAESQTEICPAVVSAGGPDFEIGKLPAGDYPILVAIEPACAFAAQACPVARTPGEWMATLRVQSGTAIGILPGPRNPAKTFRSPAFDVLGRTPIREKNAGNPISPQLGVRPDSR